jgi:hypothetical protein
MRSAMLGTNWMKIAPYTAPWSVPSPPTTIPTRNAIDRNALKLSGATNWTAIAPNAPPTPVNMALTPKVSDL